tara:strand:- start:3809 stop:3958 length:150 start_codon:yes stop_codon:yes gene_type:complete
MGCIFSCFGNDNENDNKNENIFIHRIPIIYDLDEVSISSDEYLYEKKIC